MSEISDFLILSLAFILPVNSGSLKRISYSKLYSLAHTLLLNVFSALKGTDVYILLGCFLPNIVFGLKDFHLYWESEAENRFRIHL